MVRRVRPTKATDPRLLSGERGQGDAPTYVELSPELTVGVRLMNMESMISLGILPEPLMNAAISMGKKASGERSVADFKESAALQDILCGAVIVEPPWATLEEVRENNNRCPEGKLWLGMLTDAEIGGCFQMVYKGLDAWETFRDEQYRRSAMEAGNSDGGEAEQSNIVRLVDPDEGRDEVEVAPAP